MLKASATIGTICVCTWADVLGAVAACPGLCAFAGELIGTYHGACGSVLARLIGAEVIQLAAGGTWVADFTGADERTWWIDHTNTISTAWIGGTNVEELTTARTWPAVGTHTGETEWAGNAGGVV